MFNIINLRLRQIYEDKAILVLAIVITFIFAGLVSSIYQEVAQTVVLDVGVIDEDMTIFSKNVIENVNQHPLFSQTKVTYETGIKMLKNHDIELLYVINKGAMEQVDAGNYEGLIDLYFIGDNYLSPLLGDVLVGEMFQEISTRASMNLLESATVGFDNQQEILDEALVYSDIMKASIEDGFYVKVVFEDIENNTTVNVDAITTSLIYKQMLLGVILAFISIYILFCATAIVRDYEIGLIDKINITKANHFSLVFGHYFSIVIGALPIVFIFSCINAFFGEGFISSLGLYLVVYTSYILVASGLTLILAMIIKNVSSYIVIGSATILVLGIISGSFFNIDLTVDSIKMMATATYSYQSLTQLMDIITMNALPSALEYMLFMTLNVIGMLIIAFVIHLIRINRKQP